MAIVRRETIVALANRHKLPAVYFQRPFRLFVLDYYRNQW